MRLTFFLTLLALAPGAQALTLHNDFSSHDWANWFAADNWKNGSPFDVGWRDDHINFSAGQMTLNIDDTPCATDQALCSNEPYAAANYSSLAYYSYGRVESRFRAAAGAGLVSSLFTYTGPSNGDPHDEIDIEILGQDTTKMQANYFVSGVGNHEYVIDLGFDAAADFHTYAFEWRPDRIDWWVDGSLVYSVNAAPVTPGRIMMNLWAVDASAEGWAGHYDGSPASASYDYVSYASFDQPVSVPEPGGLGLLLTGLGLLGWSGRQRLFTNGSAFVAHR